MHMEPVSFTGIYKYGTDSYSPVWLNCDFSITEQKLNIYRHCSHTRGFQMDTNQLGGVVIRYKDLRIIILVY